VSNHRQAQSDEGWTHFLPGRTPTRPANGDIRADWVVIGAGLTGLAAARQLAYNRPDDHIIIVDAQEVAHGASGRNSGYAVAISHFSGGFDASKTDEYARVNRINLAGLDHLRQTIKDNAIACDWAETGIHHAAADVAAHRELNAFRTYLDAMNIDHTPLDHGALTERLGTAHYSAGVHVHGGALVQPAALVRGLADSLPQNVTLRENTPVTAIEKASPHRVITPGATISAKRIILATNFACVNLRFMRARITASTLSGSFTRPLSDDEMASLGTRAQWGVLSVHSGGATVRLTADRRICLRNTAEFTHGRPLDEKALANRIATHRHAFEKRFAQLAHVPFEHSWSGVEGITRNGTNIFGEQAPRIWLAGGYNGSGVSRGTAFGMAIADHACGIKTPLVADCLMCPRAHWIPPRPLLDLGAAWTIRKRFKGVGADR